MPDDNTSGEVVITPYCGPFAVGLYGPNPYYIPPCNYPTPQAATDAARLAFPILKSELVILSTNGVKPNPKRKTIPNEWTLIDRITAASYAVNHQSVYELASSMKTETGIEDTTPEGDELGDDNYLLVADTSGIITVKYIPADGSAPLPASGSWVFRVGGVGSYDAPGGNSRDFSSVATGTLIEAQDASAETPVISINSGPTSKPSLVSAAFFGYIVDKSQVDNNGYATGLSYGTPALNSSRPDIKPGPNWQWLPTTDSYPGFTTVPTILGPVIKQNVLGQSNGDATNPNYQLGYQGWDYYNAVIHCFVPRPNDPVTDDDGVTVGRFLRGYRLRITDVERTVRTTEQQRYLLPGRQIGNQYIYGGYRNVNTEPIIKDVSFKYTADTGTRWLHQQVETVFQGGGQGVNYFKFGAIEGVPLDMVNGLIDAGPTFVSTHADGSPLLTMAFPPANNQSGVPQPTFKMGAMVPYQFQPGAIFAPASDAGFFSEGGDNFNGFYPINFQTQGTCWIQTTYAISTVYVTRNADKSEVEDYGAEQSFTIAMMVRRAEPVSVELPQAGGFTARAVCEIGDTLPFFNSNRLLPAYDQTVLVPTWEGFNLTVNSVDAGNGYTFYETWGGNLAYYDEDPNHGQPTDKYSWYYPGYYHPILEPGSPPVPRGWQAVKTSSSPVLGLQGWGGPSDGQLIWNGDLSSPNNQPIGRGVGGTFYVRVWLNINPFQWGGSVPYSMPPPFSQATDDFGAWVGETLYGNIPDWEPSAILAPQSLYGSDVAVDPAPPMPISPGVTGPRNIFTQHFPLPGGTPDPRYTPSLLVFAQGIDAFYGKYTAPIFPPPVTPLRYMYATGVINIYFSDDGIDSALEGFYDDEVSVPISDVRNVHNKAYWQDYSANIYTDLPASGGKSGAVIGTVSDPPGKIVLGYDSRQTIKEGGPDIAYLYASPHFATGPIRFFVNANIDLTKGTRSAGNSTAPPQFPPFSVLTLDASQGAGVGVLQVQCTDGSVRNVQIFKSPPKIRVS